LKLAITAAIGRAMTRLAIVLIMACQVKDRFAFQDFEGLKFERGSEDIANWHNYKSKNKNCRQYSQEFDATILLKQCCWHVFSATLCW
jgi:hypothetical protein